MYSRETCETSVEFDLLEEIAEREYEERCERESATFYSVEICRDADETMQAYMNGCEQRFASLEEAEGYVSTFEDFEQGLLCIKQYV